MGRFSQLESDSGMEPETLCYSGGRGYGQHDSQMALQYNQLSTDALKPWNGRPYETETTTTNTLQICMRCDRGGIRKSGIAKFA